MSSKRNVFVRMWKYIKTALGMKFDEHADPRVQIEQAIQEAQDQHRRLKEQAASVIANLKQTETKLERTMGELEKLTQNAQQALMMADEARRSGDDAKAAEYEQVAETIATKLVAVEAEIEDLKGLHVSATAAAEQAKGAVAENSQRLQEKLAQKSKLVSQLDQAKMTEQVNEAIASMNDTVGGDTPTFDEVQSKIEARMARAQGRAELEGDSVESRIREVQQAGRNVEAQSRLTELRSKLGLADDTAPAELTAGTPEVPADKVADGEATEA